MLNKNFGPSRSSDLFEKGAPLESQWSEKTNVGVDFLKLDEDRLMGSRNSSTLCVFGVVLAIGQYWPGSVWKARNSLVCIPGLIFG